MRKLKHIKVGELFQYCNENGLMYTFEENGEWNSTKTQIIRHNDFFIVIEITGTDNGLARVLCPSGTGYLRINSVRSEWLFKRIA